MILFLWVNNYKHIKQQGFNLSSKYEFEFNVTESFDNTVKGELSCIENDVLSLFKNEIKDIKAIVGENGAGKSTILEILVSNIMTNSFRGFDGFIVTDKFIFNRKGIKFNDSVKKIKCLDLKEINDLDIINHNRQPYQMKTEGGFGKIATTFLNQSSMIHYSPLLNTDRIYNVEGIAGSSKVWETDYWHYFDITTENVIVNDYNASITGSESYYISGESELLAHQTFETKRNLDFLLDDNYGDVLFKNRIESVDFKFNDFYSRYWDSIDSFFKEEDQFEGSIASALNFIEDKKFPEKNGNNALETNLYKQFIYGILKYEYNHSKNFSGGSKKNAINRTIEIFLKSTEGKRNPRTVLESYMKVTKFNKKDYTILFKKIRNIIDFILKNELIQNKDEYGFRIDFVNKDVLKNLIQQLYYSLHEDDEEEGLLYFFNFLSIEYKGLSSGEKNYLSMYSRLKSVADSIKSDQNDLIFLFDEPEATMHPQWQTMFIYYLNILLPKMFRHKNLQIIITSHSPIILSDLPKKNVLFLEKNPETGECIVSKKEDLKDTFGANIHTLYANAFFLKDKGGAIGHFAKKEINNLVERIKIAKVGTAKEIKSTIEIIGEPLIKDRLLELFYLNFPEEKFEEESIDERINYLERALVESKVIKNRLNENRRKSE